MISALHSQARRLVTLCVALSVACAGSAPGPAMIRETLPDGTVLVRHTALPDSLTVDLVEIAPIDLRGPGWEGFGQATAVAELADGSLAIAGRNPLGIWLLRPDGRVEGPLGRDGEGPGEFRYIQLGANGDTLVVQDPTTARLTRLAPTGELLRIVPSACCAYGPRLDVAADGIAWVAGRHGWLRLAPGATTGDTVPFPVDPVAHRDNAWEFAVPDAPGGPPIPMRFEIPFSAAFQYHLAPGADRLVLGGTDSLALQLLSLEGGATLRLEASLPRVAIGDSLRRAAFEEVQAGGGVRRFAEPLRDLASLGDLPLYWPAWSDLAIDRAGRLWIATPGGDEPVAVLRVFDAGGDYLGRVDAPDPRILRGHWGERRWYLVDEAPDGTSRIRRFEVPAWGEAGAR